MWDDFRCFAFILFWFLIIISHAVVLSSVYGLDCLHVFVVAVVGVCEEWCEDELDSVSEEFRARSCCPVSAAAAE